MIAAVNALPSTAPIAIGTVAGETARPPAAAAEAARASTAATDFSGGRLSAQAIIALQQDPAAGDKTKSGIAGKLSDEEEQIVAEFKRRDTEVRAHERAHAAAGGAYAGMPSFEYETGPDNQRYAVTGEVPIDSSPVAGDPAATIDKMAVVKAAALAPAKPSAQDRAVAANATATAAAAQAELNQKKAEAEQVAQSGKPADPAPIVALSVDLFV